ncbi:MAG: hypothetical protein KKH98_04840 [Spirochaetes bacterium]|nr:hypothetical protein [Spirochaetota bacterium]
MNVQTPLHFSVEPPVIDLPINKIEDISFKMIFENRGESKVIFYPDATQFSCVSGWGSPGIGLSVKNGTLKELRTYYGPPPEVPNEKYFKETIQILKPKKRYINTIKACWIPSSVIKKEHLLVSTLDPEGMDDLKKNSISDSSILVLNRTREEIIQEMNKRDDFLRPNVLVFLKGMGDWDLEFSYYQSEWVCFRPKDNIAVTATKINLRVAD